MSVVQAFTDELGDAQIQVGSALYATSWDGSPDKVYKWADPTDPTTFTSSAAFSTINAGDQGPGSICYDATNTALYVVMSVRGISPNKTLDIIKCVPSTLALSLVASVNVGSLLPGKNSSITTDGTYVYVILQFTTANAQVWKINISTGAVAATYTLAAVGATGGTNIQYDSTSGKLVIGGCGTPIRMSGPGSWVGTLDTALTAETIQFVSEISVIDDDMVIVGANAWFVNEDLANTVTRNRIIKVPISSPSSYTVYTIGWTGAWAVDGLAYDGTYLWAAARLQNTDGSSSPIAKIDPTSGDVVAFYSVGDWGINEIFPQANGFVTVSTQSANNGNSFAGSNVTYATYAESRVLSTSGGQFIVRSSSVRGGNTLRGLAAVVHTLTLSASASPTSTLPRLVSAIRSASSSTAPALARLVSASRSSSVTGAPAVGRLVSARRSASVTGTSALARLVSASRSSSVTGTATVQSTKLKLTTLSASVSATATRVVQALLKRSASASSSSTVSRSSLSTRSASAATSATAGRLVSAKRTAGATTTAVLSTLLIAAGAKVLTASAVTSATVRRLSSRALSAGAISIASTARSVSWHRAASVSSSASVVPSLPTILTLSVAAQVVAKPVMWFRRGVAMAAAAIHSLTSSPATSGSLTPSPATITDLPIVPDEH